MRTESVVYVLRYYPTLSETFVYREIQALLVRGVRVQIVALGTRRDGSLATGLPGVDVWRPRRGVRWGRMPRQCRWLAGVLGPVSVVHAHFVGEASRFAERLADRLQVPWTVTAHATGIFRPAPGMWRHLARADAVFTVAEHHQRWLAPIPTSVIRCGLPGEPRPPADPSLQPPRIVAVARDTPKKDLQRLRAATSGMDLDLVSEVPPDQVAHRLAAAQLFALPCRVAPDGNRDGIPVAMMEAMAAGLPVVTRPVAGVPELVDETVGWIGDDFEGNLALALADPRERVVRGRMARARIREHWRLDDSVDALVCCWDRFAG